MKKMKLKSQDKVMILAGKDKGKTGIVEHVNVKTGEVTVAGLNLVKKHVKVSKKNPGGGVVEKPKSMPAGKVILVCPSCSRPTRVGFKKNAKDKVRVCKKCQKEITKSEKEEKK